jgi:hypothetical protein
MSQTQRFGLLAVAVAIAVAAFLILGTGDDDEDSTSSTAPPAAGTAQETGTAPSAPEPPQPVVQKIRLHEQAPEGGMKEIQAAKGDTVRFLVISDEEDEIHLHGYDLTRKAGPGKPARFVLKAKIEGIFEIESHEAEHAGKEPLIAELRVEP